MENKRELTINGNVVIVEKLPLRKYAELLKALQELPKYVNDFEGKSNDQIFTMLPSIIGNCYPDIVRILKVATNIQTDEEIDAMGLDDLVLVLQALLEVNNFKTVFGTIKKIMARPTPEVVTPAT